MKTLRENFNGMVICFFELVIGILLLINPIGFTTGIIMTGGGLLVLSGLVNCIRYFRAEVREAARGQYLTKGLVAVIAGVFCIYNTEWFLVTFSALTVIYGVVVLLASVEKIQLCLDMLRLKKRKWYLAAISAVISLVCAVLILKNPFSSSAIIWIIAGVSLILEAFFDLFTLVVNWKRTEEKKSQEESDGKIVETENTQEDAEKTESDESIKMEDIGQSDISSDN